MNRKNFITNTLATLSTVAIGGELLAQDHNHSGMAMPGKTAKHSKAIMAAVHCKMAAEICLSHCIKLLGNGDKSLAECAVSSKEAIAACDAFITLASSESKFTKKMAELCAGICDACAKECEKHAKHHKECRDCGKSCETCSKEMKAV